MLAQSRSSALALALVTTILAGTLAGCKSSPEPHDEQETMTVRQTVAPRSLELRFVVAAPIAGDLETPITGKMRGALFHTADVGALGPRKGAEAVAKMEPRQVDLSTDEPPTWTTPALEPGEYTFLGFVDLDENSPDGPDDGDIVTRPATNRFDTTQIEGPLEIRFDYIKGSTIFG